MRMSGRATSSKPMLTLLISPPLIPRFPTSPIRVSRRLPIPSFSMTSQTNASLSTSGTLSGSRNLAAKRSASKTVSVAGSMSCWGTKPILGEELVPGYETAPVTIPLLNFFERISMSVVFPAPINRAFVSYRTDKHRWETRAARSKNSHHLPRVDTTRDVVQDDFIVGGSLAAPGRPPEWPTVGDDVGDIIPFDGIASSFRQRIRYSLPRLSL